MVIRIYAALALAGLLAVGIWYYGHTRYAAGELAGNMKVAQLTIQHAEQLQHLAELSVQVVEAARAAEKAQSQAFADIAARYEQDKVHAQEQADHVIADLRAGTLRLRQQWTCPSTATPAKVPSSAASTGQLDGDAELRAKDSGDLVRVGVECDAQVSRLQAALKAGRNGQ
jgi:uncharacterized coiled-coil protein SlyX